MGAISQRHFEPIFDRLTADEHFSIERLIVRRKFKCEKIRGGFADYLLATRQSAQAQHRCIGAHIAQRHIFDEEGCARQMVEQSFDKVHRQTINVSGGRRTYHATPWWASP